MFYAIILARKMKGSLKKPREDNYYLNRVYLREQLFNFFYQLK